MPIKVNSPSTQYSEAEITAQYEYTYADLATGNGDVVDLTPRTKQYSFKTQRRVPKTGMMLVGWGGNNGSTVTAGIIANREGITWRTKRGVQHPNFFGSVTQASTVRLGANAEGEDVNVPLSDLLPMVSPCDLVISGWDISSLNLAEAMDRSQVLDYDLMRQLAPYMRDMKPLPSIYYPDFIAANQADRVDNVLHGTKKENLEEIRKNIREFKANNELDRVVVCWTATTERFSDVIEGVNDTGGNLLASIARDEPEVSPSTIFAVACIQEGVPYINGSPQNTLVPGVVDLATHHGVPVCGDDFKSGQTKFKSVMVDFLVSAGIKPVSIVSYNHLGNNDGKNLSAPAQFRSKEITKSNVVDDMVASNSILYKPGEHPDHCVVIKYIPYVGDSKRAMDEYTSEIFLGGLNTIVVHNTCEDSLLAAPLIIDLVVLMELMTRITYKTDSMQEYETFHPIMSILSYLLKAPFVPSGTPVVNALFKQRMCMENIFRACLGLPPTHNMGLEHKTCLTTK